MRDTPLGQRVVFGFVTASVVIGLATQDTAENCVKELSLDGLRFKKPVFHGDSISAYTEVLAKEADAGEQGGWVRFKHWGVNQHGDVVFEGERSVLIKRRPEPAPQSRDRPE